jgi:hypothetical protein
MDRALEFEDTSSPCEMLNDSYSLAVMSGGLHTSLLDHCAGEELSWWDWRRWRPYYGPVVAWLTDWVAPTVSSQSCPPQSNPANCRADDTYPTISQTEVAAAVSATDTTKMVVAFVDSGHVDEGSRIGYARSTDSGNSWLDRGFPPPPADGANSSDPVLAADMSGNIYLGRIVVIDVQGVANYRIGVRSQKTGAIPLHSQLMPVPGETRRTNRR